MGYRKLHVPPVKKNNKKQLEVGYSHIFVCYYAPVYRQTWPTKSY